ncbi:hypothetical protein BD626DRAFT_507787 [Schizophyllum amplum]|uniref:Uncharacterized protein n=1 Tax=Schizophyllum amplum TaxID=97359 RepID=A0A550C486_9AGAR|nr:hypothetical protein BD626DRAFT_507787 [Auriculariopsis ampla]
MYGAAMNTQYDRNYTTEAQSQVGSGRWARGKEEVCWRFLRARLSHLGPALCRRLRRLRAPRQSGLELGQHIRVSQESRRRPANFTPLALRASGALDHQVVASQPPQRTWASPVHLDVSGDRVPHPIGTASMLLCGRRSWIAGV